MDPPSSPTARPISRPSAVTSAPPTSAPLCVEVEHALEPRLGLVDVAAHLPVRLGGGEAEAVGGGEVAEARRVLGLEPEELGGELRREVAPLRREGVERDPRAGDAAEVELEVRQVQQRLPERGDAARAAPHVHRGLEVLDRGGEIALGLGDAGEVQARRAHAARVARLLGGGERFLVGGLRLAEALVPLERERERSQRDGEQAGLADRARDPHGLFERRARFAVAR